MKDREKVEKGLRICTSKEPCNGCPYLNERNCSLSMVADALALLKEQETVEPIKMQRMDSNFSFFVPYFLCGNCRYELEGKDVMFCAHCGRPVKWDD